MAILSHKRLMLCRKKHFFINISWHGGYGPLLSLFEDLEVPILHKSPIVWPGLSKTSAPLYCSQRFTQTNVKFQLVLNTDLATRPQGKLKDLKNGWGAVKFGILSDFMDFSLCICNWAWEICRQYFSGASLQEPSLWLVKWKYCSIESKQMHHLQIEEG